MNVSENVFAFLLSGFGKSSAKQRVDLWSQVHTVLPPTYKHSLWSLHQTNAMNIRCLSLSYLLLMLLL